MKICLRCLWLSPKRAEAQTYVGMPDFWIQSPRLSDSNVVHKSNIYPTWKFYCSTRKQVWASFIPGKFLYHAYLRTQWPGAIQ